MASRIELIVGDALGSIEALPGPFDLVWIDADKRGYPAYYEAVLPKLADRGLIVADNLFRAGQAMDASVRERRRRRDPGLRPAASRPTSACTTCC